MTSRTTAGSGAKGLRALSILVLLSLGALLASACVSSRQATDEERAKENASSSSSSRDSNEDDQDEDFDRDGMETMRPSEMGYSDTLELAISDVEEMWSDTFPEVYGDEYDPIDPADIIAGSPGVDLPDCSGFEVEYDPDLIGNAFYCYDADYVAYDDEELFPDIFEKFGSVSVAFVLAHEFGHRIQGEAGFFDDPLDSIVFELQADCFAGVWAARVAGGDSDLIQVTPGALESGLAGFFDFRDEVGSDPEDPAAHGAGFDRVNAFQEGFEQGAEHCAGYVDQLPEIAQMEFMPDDLETGGNLELDEAITVAMEGLNQYWTERDPEFEPIEDLESYDPDDESLPECGDDLDEPDELELQVFYCPLDNSIAWDERLFDEVSENGDFGVMTILALEWARASQEANGIDSSDPDAMLEADCLTGAFAGAVSDGELVYVDPTTNDTVLDPVTGQPELTIGISAGDLDEAIQSFLGFTSFGDDDEEEREPDIAFTRIQAFRAGFFEGPDTCGDITANLLDN